MSGSLFTGTPQAATSYVATSNEVPKWLQDAIYNQIQLSTNVANRPFQQYNLPMVAELSPLQQQAYQRVQQNVGAFQPTIDAATAAAQNLTTSTGTATAAQPLMQQAGALNQITATQPYLTQQSALLGGLNYGRPATTLDPYVSQSIQTSGIQAAQPQLTAAGNLITGAASPATASQLQADQNQYLRQQMVDANLSRGQTLADRAAAMNAVSAAQPLLGRAETATAQSLAERALTAANPYLQAAGKTSASQVGQYMSPYQQNVLDVIAKQGARNLSENLLPAVSDSFIKAGQFGSSRMGEFGSRALRDTQEAILNQQARLAQEGYGQGLSAAQADLARQAQLAGTVGSISGADLSRVLQGGAQYGNLGQTTGQLTAQQMQNLAGLSQAQAAAGQAQQQLGLGGAQAVQAAQQADLARRISAGAQLADVGQTAGALTGAQQEAILRGGQALSGAQQQSIAQSLQGAGILGQQAQMAGAATGAQQGALTNLAQLAAGNATTDLARQLAASSQLSEIAQRGQAMRAADVAALESAGFGQQQQQQAILNAARQQFEAQQNYPKQQLDFLSTQIRGLAPITPSVQTQTGQTSGATYSPSPLSQLATGLYTFKGLQGI